MLSTEAKLLSLINVIKDSPKRMAGNLIACPPVIIARAAGNPSGQTRLWSLIISFLLASEQTDYFRYTFQ